MASCVAFCWHAFAWYANRRSSVRLVSPLGEERQPSGGRSRSLAVKLQRRRFKTRVEFQLSSGAPNDGFLSDPLKRYFRLSGAPLKLCRFVLGCSIIFLSGELESFRNY